MGVALTIVKKLLGLFGYGIHQRRFDTKKYGYTHNPPYTYHTFSPWFSGWFSDIYAGAKTDVTQDRCYMLYRFSQYASSLGGDFAECGVYKGGTAYIIAQACGKRKLHLFDTFKGMPEQADGDPSQHLKGDMGDTSLDAVKAYLKPYPQIVYHKGLIPETFEPVKQLRFVFVHVDVDLYETSMDCCKFFYDRLVRGGVMIFDDYGFPRYEQAQKRAVDEYFHDKPENPISLRTGQCLVLKEHKRGETFWKSA